jgi:hypothetical protein
LTNLYSVFKASIGLSGTEKLNLRSSGADSYLRKPPQLIKLDKEKKPLTNAKDRYKKLKREKTERCGVERAITKCRAIINV